MLAGAFFRFYAGEGSVVTESLSMADISLTPRRTKKVKYRKLTLTLAPCILHIKQKDSIVIEALCKYDDNRWH